MEEIQILTFKPFTLADKPLIDAYFGEHHYEASDNSFTTLFMWQKAYGISWAEENGILFVKGGEAAGSPFLLPPFAGKDAKFVDGLKIAQEWFKENNLPFQLKGVQPIIKERMEKLCPDCYTFTPDRDNFEYIYRTEDLITLSGKKLRQKKNHLNQFRMQYTNYEYMPITQDVIPQCRDTAAQWAEQHQEEGAQEELEAINLLFDHWEELGLVGGCIKLFGHIEAFTIGEMLNDRMALIHIEKANPTIRGLYQAINNEFIRHEFAHTEFVNREEDMGLPGLRQAKESYNPDHFAEKFDAIYTEHGPCNDETGCPLTF